MAKATATLVRQLGGLDDEDAHNLFRLSSEPELVALIDSQILVASAWLRSRAPTHYASVDADITALFAQGEAYVTLMFLGDMLKGRKVMGTHWAVDQEDSSAFNLLIETDWQGKAEMLLSSYLTIDTGAAPIAFPFFGIGRVLDYTDLQNTEQELREIADKAIGYNPVAS